MWLFSHTMFLYPMYIALVIPMFYIHSLHVILPDDVEKVSHLHIVDFYYKLTTSAASSKSVSSSLRTRFSLVRQCMDIEVYEYPAAISGKRYSYSRSTRNKEL